MSTPLIVLAVILACFALVLIPFMMVKGDSQKKRSGQYPPEKQGKRHHGKKKKR